MKTFHVSKGPFKERLYFSTEEIERTCDDELKKTGLYPKKPSPVRIERFIEKRFDVTPQYELLPEGLLGFTRFGSQGVQEVIISSSLSEEKTRPSERRINTTLAHEAGHGLLHSGLFALGCHSRSLFEKNDLDGQNQKILCRDKTQRYDGRWWEFQANQVMGALLLPKEWVRAALKSFLIESGVFKKEILSDTKRGLAEKVLSEIFNVNPVVVRIRLDILYPRSDTRQLTL